ncbi:MAG: GTPase, partial [Acetatifactor sp.]|nr:GTPase [Acetatifactor sp.]
MKPVYIINGFLESGKTEFITYTISQPYFRIQGKTLIIACEEGEVEYDRKLLRNVTVVTVDSLEKLTPAFLTAERKKCRASQIIVEYNG